MYRVAVVVGSLRRNSINRRLALAMAKLARPRLEFLFARVDDLPLYNEELWESPPVSVLRWKSEIDSADAALLVTPEFNRSVTPVTLNTLTWASRPAGKNSWARKPVGLVGATPGRVGTAVAQQHMRSILGMLDAFVMGSPEAYIMLGEGAIDENYDVALDSMRGFLRLYIERFAAHIEFIKR